MEFVDQILDSIDNNGNLAGESLVDSATSESSEGVQQASSAPDDVGSNKSIETKAPVAFENNGNGERDGSGVEGENGDTYGRNGTNANGDSYENNPDGSDSETEHKAAGKVNHRKEEGNNSGGGKRRKVSEMSALELAEHKAEKWKRRAKEMRRAKESLEEEFNKYKDLNPRAFDNDEDRMEFLAWKASTAQRLNDMDSDLEAIDEEQSREAFSAKVADCYSSEGAVQFEKLDDHYRGAFALMCGNVDPDNVILDFLSGSRYEAPMREVIYKNGKLQEELFRNYGNPMIASAERLNTLKELERQVAEFYQRNRGNAAPARTAKANVTYPNNVAPNTDNVKNRQQMGVRQRFVLPSMQNRVAAATANNTMARQQQGNVAPQGVRAPQANPNQFAARKATGSLTRGSEPSQVMDLSSQADALFKELMRSGI